MPAISLPVAVIGAGPIGLAAAAHLAERDIPFVLLEAGAGPATAVREWAHVRIFSPWDVNVDAAARRLLERSGWIAPPCDDLPTGGELVERYLAPLAALPQIAPHIRYGARPPSTDGAPRPVVGPPSTDRVGEGRNRRSSGFPSAGWVRSWLCWSIGVGSVLDGKDVDPVVAVGARGPRFILYLRAGRRR